MNNGIVAQGVAPIAMPYGLLGAPGPVLMPDAAWAYEPDADAYIRRVEAADGVPLEPAVRRAIAEFVIGLKTDGLWSKLGNALLMCGARTISGAVVPLIGPTTTVTSFVSGDYARKTGIASSAYNTTKKIATNYTDPFTQNDFHLSVYATAANGVGFQPMVQGLPNAGTLNNRIIGGNTSSTVTLQARSDSNGGVSLTSAVGLHAAIRTASNTATGYLAGSTGTNTRTSVSALGQAYTLFGGTDARLAWYSCGSSITAATLETRVAAVIAAIGRAL